MVNGTSKRMTALIVSAALAIGSLGLSWTAPRASAAPEEANVALGKPVASSEAGEPVWPQFGPENAVNGIADAHDGWSADSAVWADKPVVQPWLQIDLQDEYEIRKVEVVARPGLDDSGNPWYDGERKNFEIRASNDPDFASYEVLGSVSAVPFADPVWSVAPEASDRAYRYIRYQKTAVEYAFLTEMRVFGVPKDDPSSEPEPEPEPTASVTASVYADMNRANGHVRLYGSLTSGPGNAVTVKVLDPAGLLDYIDQGVTGPGGNYQFEYPLDETVGGTYLAQVGGTGVTAPARTPFTYVKPSVPPDDGNGNGNGSGNGGTAGGSGQEPDGGGRIETGDDGTLIGKPGLDRGTGQAVLNIGADDIEAALRQAIPDGKGIKTVTIRVESLPDAQAYVQRMPAAAIAASSGDVRFRVETAAGTVVVPANMLKPAEIAGADTVDLVIRPVEPAQLGAAMRARIGSRPVVEIYLAVNGSVHPWHNPAAPITVFVPYRPTPDELANAEHLVVLYLDDAGAAVPVTSGRYDAQSGTMIFTTPHLSQYAVAYVNKSFADLARAEWARHAVEVLASKGVISGMSETAFSPGSRVTRADFLMLLVRTLGLAAEAGEDFADVKPGDYYYDAVGIARALGFAEGVGGNRFDPRAPISRQDMMALTARALNKFGELAIPASAEALEPFDDRAAVAGYAEASVAALVREELIVGSDGQLHPRGMTTRAEAAVFLYKIYKLGG